jgi:tartrate-resistant acid phosphatase type 5
MKGQPPTWVVAPILAMGVLSASACTQTAASSPTTPTASGAPVTPATNAQTVEAPTTFAIIGDYGLGSDSEASVARLVESWSPAYIVAVGDDYYAPAGGNGTAKYDASTGAYYCRWLANVTTTGKRCPSGLAATNAFFPAMGNHDYTDAQPSPDTYVTYFDLPGKGFVNTSGNERFYDFVEGSIHFFVIDSDPHEPAGTDSTSTQAQWLKAQLAASTSRWNIVYDHHPPYSSDDSHGSTPNMQWPFAEWGADAVISGHSHTYERIMRDGIVYFVNGMGGASRYKFTTPTSGSAIRYNGNWGAQQVTVTPTSLTFAFYNVDGSLIDSYSIPTK